MFNLDQAIADWRRHLAASGIKSRAVLDELESHLRDEVENQMRTGVNGERAFEMAVQSIGQPAALRREFAKSGRTRNAHLQKLKSVFLRFISVPFLPANELALTP